MVGMNQITFKPIIQMFQVEGMVALGKMLNPATNEITKNMEHAKYVIDVLSILQEKTKGNVDEAEKKFLDQSLAALRLNYLEEQSRGSADSAPSTDSAPSAEENGSAGDHA